MGAMVGILDNSQKLETDCITLTRDDYWDAPDCIDEPQDFTCQRCRGKGFVPGIRKGRTTMIRCRCR
jgi:hypothetical protein